MAQSPKPGVSKLKNEDGLLLNHPEFGKLAGRIGVENATFDVFTRLRNMNVPGHAFGDILFFKPTWLHGLTVHDALAYENGPKTIHRWIDDLAGRFALAEPVSPKSDLTPAAPADAALKPDPQENRMSATKLPQPTAAKFRTAPPPLTFTRQTLRPQVEAAVDDREMTHDEINEAIDDLLPSL